MLTQKMTTSQFDFQVITLGNRDCCTKSPSDAASVFNQRIRINTSGCKFCLSILRMRSWRDLLDRLVAGPYIYVCHFPIILIILCSTCQQLTCEDSYELLWRVCKALIIVSDVPPPPEDTQRVLITFWTAKGSKPILQFVFLSHPSRCQTW